MKDETIHLSGLNGLRAIASLSVVISHINLLPNISDFGLPSLFAFSISIGAFAVTLFFVISGFLITFLLIKEIEKRKDVDTKKFYMRRILRIWPIYYLFLIISIFAYVVLGNQSVILKNSLFFYIFFSANIPFIIKQGGLSMIFHYWSIGVEEQFYLFWPWVVNLSKNLLLKIAIIIFTLFFGFKILSWINFGVDSISYKFFAVNRFDCMMIGAIGAMLYVHQNISFINLFSNKIIQLLSWVLLILVSVNVIRLPWPIAHEIVSVAVLSIIMGQITVNKRIVNLENKVCDFIGKISYGIYVIHPLIIFLLSIVFRQLQMSLSLKYILVYCSVIIITIFTAWLSFNFFEKPFLNLKTKFAVIQSSSSKYNL